jgi:hypothetical protein
VIIKINKIGKIANQDQILPIENAIKPKLAKIFNKACPDVIFANSRTAKLIIREKFEINSIKIIKGVIIKGAPFGKKWLNIKILLTKKL